jgi:hypothetical protein
MVEAPSQWEVDGRSSTEGRGMNLMPIFPLEPINIS